MIPIEVIFLLSLPGFFISMWAGMMCYSAIREYQSLTGDDAKLLSRLMIFVWMLWGIVLMFALYGLGA